MYPLCWDCIWGRWELGTGDWGLETGDWRLETGDWRLETGDWRLETGDWVLIDDSLRPPAPSPQPPCLCSVLLSVRPTSRVVPGSFFHNQTLWADSNLCRQEPRVDVSG